MKTQTPQQIADAAAKRAASVAARKASGGLTVRQQRAAAKAAKAGMPAPPPPAPRVRAPRVARPTATRRRRHFNPFAGTFNAGSTTRPSNLPPANGAPIFAQPKPSLRALRLVALAAIEDAFRQFLLEHRANVTDDMRAAYAKYTKVKAIAMGGLAAAANDATRNEADAALRRAALQLITLGF